MTPFSGLFFFYILFVVLIIAVILGVNEKSIRLYGTAATIFMLSIIFSNSIRQGIYLILFFIGELILIKIYSLIIKKYKQRYILWVMILLSLLPLILVKWGNILIHRNVGFLGVSYLTFKVIQMIIEIYDGLITEVKIFDFTYFLLFFPTISSGPIDRSRRFNEDIHKKLSSKEYVELLREGIWKLFWGIAYKFIFATLIYSYWMSKIPKEHTIINTLNYMYGYSFYLFFDFAGYSLMAVGTSYILGVKTPDNFNMPFISKDIKEFWNRWHMSLSFWFRDFIYTRFVMAALKNKWFKKYTASYIGYAITMITMGIWHGNEVYYIIYGAYHGILIIITDYFQRKSSMYKKYKKNKLWNTLSTVVTFNIVCFGFLIFSGYLFK